MNKHFLLLGFLSLGFWASTQPRSSNSVTPPPACQRLNVAMAGRHWSKDTLTSFVNPITQSGFSNKTISTKQILPFATVYQNDENLEFGLEEKRQEGSIGKLVNTYEVLLKFKMFATSYDGNCLGCRCHAEDIGGAVKGNRIDLGFENVKEGNWSAHWTEIYLLQ